MTKEEFCVVKYGVYDIEICVGVEELELFRRPANG